MYLLLLSAMLSSLDGLGALSITANKDQLKVGEICTLWFDIDTSDYNYIRVVNKVDSTLLFLNERSKYQGVVNRIYFEFTSLDVIETNTRNFRILVQNKVDSKFEYLIADSAKLSFSKHNNLPSSISPSIPISIIQTKRNRIGFYMLISLIITIFAFVIYRLTNKGKSQKVEHSEQSDYHIYETRIYNLMLSSGFKFNRANSIQEIEEQNKLLLQNRASEEMFLILKELKANKYEGKVLTKQLMDRINAI